MWSVECDRSGREQELHFVVSHELKKLDRIAVLSGVRLSAPQRVVEVEISYDYVITSNVLPQNLVTRMLRIFIRLTPKLKFL
jgi:hypothetical protein